MAKKLLLPWAALFLVVQALGQSSAPPEISAHELEEMSAKFSSTYPDAFATAYRIDGTTIKTMLAEGAVSVQVVNGLTGSGDRVILLVPSNKGGQIYIEYETNLCPPVCDKNGTPAIKITAENAERYIANFTKANPKAAINSFLISGEMVNLMGSGNNFRSYCIVNNGSLQMAFTKVDGSGRSIDQNIYVSSTLCPPVCD